MDLLIELKTNDKEIFINYKDIADINWHLHSIVEIKDIKKID